MSKSEMIDGVEWRKSSELIAYPDALGWMNDRIAAIAAGEAAECVWLLEHPPLYTAGTSADPAELIDDRFPVFDAGRGGRYTYHGPGQRVAYLMLDLNKRGRDIRCFVHAVEGWVIATLDRLGVHSWRAPGRIGIWTSIENQEAKIGAIGVRVRRWVTMHGLSINVAPDLSHFGGIIPCGLAEFPVTSLKDLGRSAHLEDVDDALMAEFQGFLKNLSKL